MSLIIATGSNLGDKKLFLKKAQESLCESFQLIQASDIFTSLAVDYEDQPSFYNQVLEFKLPTTIGPEQTIELLLDIEKKMGRTRDIDKGPRIIDIDIIFWGLNTIEIPSKLYVPHPRWQERSFVVKPLTQLPFFQTAKKYFKIPSNFEVDALPVT